MSISNFKIDKSKFTLSYYEKYLKYKSKYLQLTKLIGGGKESAKQMFLARFNDDIKTILNNDRSRGFLVFDSEPKDNLSNIFEQIYNKVEKNNKTIDWIIKSYIGNTFGRPSSLENFGRFKDALSKYNVLNDNIKGIKPIVNINGVIELEAFIESPENIEHFIKIAEKKAKQKKRDERNKRDQPLKEAKVGENDKEIILETNFVTIYKPTTEAGSKYYGNHTKWCTSASEHSSFDYYNSQGSLYIIQSKFLPELKFQLYVGNGNIQDEVRNAKNEYVKIDFVEVTFNDNNLNKWLDELWEEKVLYNKDTKEIIIGTSDILKFTSDKLKKLFSKVPDLKSLTLTRNQSFDDSLKGLTSLQSLTLKYFDQPLNDSLKGLTSLLSLNLNSYNQLLGDSLNDLINLQSLAFGDAFDKPLGDSLKGLTSLQLLTFRWNFNQPLSDSLKGLTNLQLLSFGMEFNNGEKPLGDSLKGLTSLKKLELGNYNQPLDDSLKELNSLQELGLGKYNQPLGDSLKGLTSLQTLSLGMKFKQPLNDSLKGLTNLKSLDLGMNFNNGGHQLGDSLKDLTSLPSLDLGEYNQPLDDSLKGLTNLQSLSFGMSFNHSLGDSLKGLTSLQSLSFMRYYQPLGDSLKGLTNLQSITFGSQLNESLEDSLKYLPNLKTVNGKPVPSTA
jgi:hypothetical protein